MANDGVEKDNDGVEKAMRHVARIVKQRHSATGVLGWISPHGVCIGRIADLASEWICCDPSGRVGAARIADFVAKAVVVHACDPDVPGRTGSEVALLARRLGSSVAMALLSEASVGPAAEDLRWFIWTPPTVAMRAPTGDDDGDERDDGSMDHVREYGEEYPVRLALRASTYVSPNSISPGHPGGDVAIPDGPRWVVQARNEGGYCATEVDLIDLLRWLSVHRGDLLVSCGILLGERDRIVEFARSKVDEIMDGEFGTELVEAADVWRISQSIVAGLLSCFDRRA